ncbi:hypothetical protein JCM19233_6250 [Vibrio astriarenae]|nr:hypothetical protein JCM19233_6250 [Vibrio sp. C7]
MKHTIVFSSIIASLSLAAIPAVASTPSARIIDGTPAPEANGHILGHLYREAFLLIKDRYAEPATLVGDMY